MKGELALVGSVGIGNKYFAWMSSVVGKICDFSVMLANAEIMQCTIAASDSCRSMRCRIHPINRHRATLARAEPETYVIPFDVSGEEVRVGSELRFLRRCNIGDPEQRLIIRSRSCGVGQLRAVGRPARRGNIGVSLADSSRGATGRWNDHHVARAECLA